MNAGISIIVSLVQFVLHLKCIAKVNKALGEIRHYIRCRNRSVTLKRAGTDAGTGRRTHAAGPGPLNPVKTSRDCVMCVLGIAISRYVHLLHLTVASLALSLTNTLPQIRTPL